MTRNRVLRVRTTALLTAIAAVIGGTNIASAQSGQTMADAFQPEYSALNTRIGHIKPWEDSGFPSIAWQLVENLEELPEGTTFIAETGTFASEFVDGLITSKIDSSTGEVQHRLSQTISRSGIPPRNYSNKVVVRVLYPDGSEELVKPRYTISIADNIFYEPSHRNDPTPKVSPGTTVSIPLQVNNEFKIPEGSKVVEDRYGSITDARLRGIGIDISESTGEIKVTFPEDRTGKVWFRTELIYADGTYDEIHYSFDVTQTPSGNAVRSPFASSLSSR